MFWSIQVTHGTKRYWWQLKNITSDAAFDLNPLLSQESILFREEVKLCDVHAVLTHKDGFEMLCMTSVKSLNYIFGSVTALGPRLVLLVCAPAMQILMCQRLLRTDAGLTITSCWADWTIAGPQHLLPLLAPYLHIKWIRTPSFMGSCGLVHSSPLHYPPLHWTSESLAYSLLKLISDLRTCMWFGGGVSSWCFGLERFPFSVCRWTDDMVILLCKFTVWTFTPSRRWSNNHGHPRVYIPSSGLNSTWKINCSKLNCWKGDCEVSKLSLA